MWTTKDGRITKISDMDDRHLINSIRFLRSTVKGMKLRHELAGFFALNFVQGEMAELTIEHSLAQEAAMTDDEWLEYHTSYEDLIEEAKRRDIVMFIGAEFFRMLK